MKRLISITLTVFLIVLASINTCSQVVTFNKTYGQMPYNYGKRILQASDQGYYILANENGNIANTNIHIIRTDSLGIILFEKTIGDASVYSANDFIRTSDKGLLITGLTNKNTQNGYDVLLVKTDSNANVQWEKTYGGSDWDIGNSVIETPDEAYLISGQTFSYGPEAGNIYIIKTNFSGDTLWTRVFGGDSVDYAMSADVRFDGSYLIGATTNSFGHGNYDGYVLNLAPNGDTLWTETYGEDKEDMLNSLKSTPDSGFVFVGSTKSYNAIEHETWLMKFDKNRNYIWKIPQPWEIGWADDVANSVTIGNSATYIISGYTTGAGIGGKELSFLVMAENNVFVHSLTGGFSGDDAGYDAIQTNDGGFIIIGNAEESGIGISNIYVIKISNDFSFSPTTEHMVGIENNDTVKNNSLFGIYPNFSDGKYYLKVNDTEVLSDYSIEVSDVMGRIVYSDKALQNKTSEILIDLSQQTSGLYFISVYNKAHLSCFKVIKQ